MLILRFAVLFSVATPFAWSFVPSSTSSSQDPEKSFEIELIDAGAEPRQALRFTPRVGDEAELSMGMTQSQEITLDGRAIPMPAAPALRMTMSTKAEAISEAGLVTQSWKDLNCEIIGEVDDGMRTQLEKVFDPLGDFSGSVSFDSRGFVHETDFEIPEDAERMLKTILVGFERSMSEIVLPFPEEAVGLGASWNVSSDIEMNGVSMRSVSRVELTALDENGVTLAITNEISADAQKIENDQLPPGAELELLSCSGEGSGESRIEFIHYHPVASTVDSNVEMAMKTTTGKNTQTMDMKISMQIEAERHALETAK